MYTNVYMYKKAFFHEIFLYAILIQMFTIEAIFNHMCSIGAVLIQMYAMDDRFGSDRRTFSAHRPRQVVCQDGRFGRADLIKLRCYMKHIHDTWSKIGSLHYHDRYSC